jgi:phenylalanine-4-hydroxylase
MQWEKLRDGLQKEFSFSNQEQIQNWLEEVGKVASQLGHEPDKIVQKENKVVVFLTTHDAGNQITNLDWQLSQKLDSAFYALSGGIKTHKIKDSEAVSVWHALFSRQVLNLKDKAHPLFWDGLKNLNLSESHIPNTEQLSSELKKLSGFKIVKAQVQYAEDREWFKLLLKRKIMATDYIRVMEDLDFTPLPDIFHDVFGHLAILSHRPIADLAEKFGRTFIFAETDLQRFMTERLWWSSMEFGLMKTTGKVVIFGAGLLSSFGETSHAFKSSSLHVDFAFDLLPNLDRSPHNFHQQYLIFESFEQISKALDWITNHPKG